ncbi:membrane protein, partial [Stenotrophomonas maltophilia]
MDAMPPLPPTPVPPPTTAVPAFSPQDADHLRM